MADLVLPAFEMDCRDWIVLSPGDAGMPEDVAGSPLLAVLSTIVIEDDLLEARGALSVGLTEGADDLETAAVAPGAPAQELVGMDASPGTRRYVIPAPNNHPLALVAEFVIGEKGSEALLERVHQLMRSFRWQAA
ncbi:MAG: hypothetical protein QOH89_2261 [Pseudonocardiales bacterium]|jgi:hypothetical protein|nr:hypothetical protein [Pseudonocardiales bacterium]